MKHLIFFLIAMVLSITASATPYAVNADVVNVRSEANVNSAVVGTLERGETVDVTGDIKDGWAKMNFHGRLGYVNAQFLKERGWFGRVVHFIFSSDGQAEWLVIVKWIVIVGLIFVLFRYILAIIVNMLAFGAFFGIVVLVFGFIVHWIGWLESTSNYMMFSYGFYIGAGIGLVYSIINFRGTIEEGNSYRFGTSGSTNVDSNGLKHYRVLDEHGFAHNLTQTYQYSDTHYTDENGRPWIHDNSGFRRG